MDPFGELLNDPRVAQGFETLFSTPSSRKERREERQLDIMNNRLLRGSDDPAALRLANEFQKARESGDTQRMNDIAMFAKTMDKGIAVGMDGAYAPLMGYGDALGSIKGDVKTDETQAQKDVELTMNPVIAQQTKAAEQVGTNMGEKRVALDNQSAMLPQLESMVEKLNKVGANSTYTLAGQARDAIMRQTDQPASQGAVNRAELISTVDNQILPLLRDTFGAAFTAAEGDRLRATLSDADQSPAEREAVLKSFIEQKRQSIDTLKRQTAGYPQPAAASPQYQKQDVEAELRRRGLLK